MRIFHRWNERGVTLIAALAAAGALGFVVYIILRSFEIFSVGKLSFARRLQGDEAMVAASVGVQQADFNEILTQCRTRAILNSPQPRASVCAPNGVLNRALPNPPGAIQPWTMEVVRDAYGRPSADGEVCVELLHCRHLASGRILEVMVQGNWIDPHQPTVATQRRLTFRRTRW